MNITFLIGNGFDINLGLKTSYKDFYPYYIKKYPDEMISKIISLNHDNDFNNWADLELGLGNMLKSISKDKIVDFLNSKGILEECLTDYLKKQNSFFKISDSKKAIEKFKNNIVGFYNGFNSEETEKYKNTISTYRSDITVSFITFNYTDTLDKIVEECQKETKIIGSFRDGPGNLRSILISKPLHIHGTLEEGMVLGVNDDSQISNDEFKNDIDFQNYFIKPKVLTELGEQKISKAKQIIDNSNYVCLFGLSIGDTDSFWWSYLMEWLQRDNNNRMVLYVRGDNVSFSAQQYLRKRDDSRKYMLKQARCSKAEIIQKVSGRIIVVNNSKIFDLPGIIIKAKEESIPNNYFVKNERMAIPVFKNDDDNLLSVKIEPDLIKSKNLIEGIDLTKAANFILSEGKDNG